MRAIEIGAKPLPYLTCKLLGRFFPALYWSAVSNLRLREVPEPRLLWRDWVRVRPILSGICASDLAGVTLKHSFDSFMSAFASFPIGLGHEVVGRVVEVGEGRLRQSSPQDYVGRTGCPSVDGREVSVGDRVNLDPYLHCRIRGIDPPCPSCQRGETATCQNFHEGKLPPGTGSNNFTRGTWSDCFLPTSRMLVGGADIVFDSVGSTETLANAMKFTRPHGTLVVVGIGYPKRLDWTPVWLQEMRILGSVGQGWESWQGERLHTSVLVHRLIQEGRLDPTPMLTHRFDLADYGRAFATALGKGQSQAVKVAFAFS
jgi:threonine dehydrogenase-like Zn-dependent dehydrogenase